MKRLIWLIALIALTMTANHAAAFQVPDRSLFADASLKLIPVQSFQFELGMSNGLIRRSLSQEGYSDIKITKRRLTKARAEACKQRKRYLVEVKFDGKVRQIKQIGRCRATVNAGQARDALRKKGYRKIQLVSSGKGFIAAACRDKRRYRLSLNQYGDVRRET